MALTDPNALTGTISICVNKDNGIPEYKDFFPKTETHQITDFNEATIDLINNKVSSLVPTVYAYKTTLLTSMWHDSDNSQFPKQYVINNDLISENDIPEVVFVDNIVARLAGINSLVESQNNRLIITAKTVPLQDLNIYYYIYKPTNASGDWNTSKAYMSKLKLNNYLSLSKNQWQKETITVNNITINRYKYDINVNNINANDVIDVCIPEYSQLYPIVKSDTNKITLYSYIKPNRDLNNVTYRKYEGTFIDEDDYSGYMPKVYSKTVTTDPYEWGREDLQGTNCHFSYTINDINIKATDLIEVITHPDSIPLLAQCQINSIAITENGRCTIYCVNQPKTSLKFSYNIYHCKSINEATPSQQQYMIKKGIKNYTLTTPNWVKTNRESYPYLYTISANCNENDVVDVVINNLSQQYTTPLYPLIETTNGYINLYSKIRPTGNINIEYYIFEAAE